MVAVLWSVEGRGNGVCVRRDAEGWWLKWGGVQSDYAKLCPYVLAWKFHPSPGFATPLGKMYLLLFVQRSVYGHQRRERESERPGGRLEGVNGERRGEAGVW